MSDLGREHEPYISSGEINSKSRTRPARWSASGLILKTRTRPWTTLTAAPFTAKDGSFWSNLRPSNTEPYLRLNAEATDRATMERVRDRVLALVRS